MDIRRKIKKKYKVGKDVLHKLFVKFNEAIYKGFNILTIIAFVIIIQSFLSKLLVIKNYKMLLDAYCSKDYIQTIKYCNKLEHEKNIDIKDIKIESKYNAGVVFYDNGDYEDSISILSDIKYYQDSANIIKDCKYNKAIIFIKNNDLEEAISILKEDIYYKDTKNLLNNIIKKYAEGEKYKEAIEVYELKEDKYNIEQLITKHPNYSNLLSKYINFNILISSDSTTNKFASNDMNIINEVKTYANALLKNGDNKDYEKICKKALYVYDRDINGNKDNEWLCDETDKWHYRVRKGEIAKNEMIIDNDEIYYFDNNGYIVKNKYINYLSNTYFFGEDGKAIKNSIYDSHYFDEDGKMARSCICNYNGDSYCLDNEGVIVKNKLINGYYFKENGKMLKNGYDSRGIWHDMNGTPKYGWAKQNDGWHYYDNAGNEVKDYWVEDNGKKYYIGNDYIMHVGFINISDYTYYFSINGEMATGWKNIGGNSYYFHETDKKESPKGSMAKNEVIDGYLLNSQGIREKVHHLKIVIVQKRKNQKRKKDMIGRGLYEFY